jgi:hypothetical protein
MRPTHPPSRARRVGFTPVLTWVPGSRPPWWTRLGGIRSDSPAGTRRPAGRTETYDRPRPATSRGETGSAGSDDCGARAIGGLRWSRQGGRRRAKRRKIFPRRTEQVPTHGVRESSGGPCARSGSSRDAGSRGQRRAQPSNIASRLLISWGLESSATFGRNGVWSNTESWIGRSGAHRALAALAPASEPVCFSLWTAAYLRALGSAGLPVEHRRSSRLRP